MAVILPPVPSVIKYRFLNDVGASLNASWHLFMHTTAGPVVTADLTSLANNAAASWLANLAPRVPTTTVLREVVTEDLGHSSTIPGEWAGSHAGTYPTAGQSAEVATLVNFKIARRYRGGKPRVYLPQGVSAQMNNPVQWQSTYVSQVQGDWANFINAILSSSPPSATIDKQVSVSYFSGHSGVPPVPTPRPTPLVDDVIYATVNSIPASQRRRMGR
ncbi:MAG: hypothetical protein HRJ53_07915 [Acidobacteria bacterium Pan2503]|uniref:Uncharacterized protein n=1 Tax=Candidatus Acidiferrum panamense TaxID=2741543 RepID=A0A7V8NP18_9BACT|nr:hypothetical protein [Candidatus Acidoferrum panamensis]